MISKKQWTKRCTPEGVEQRKGEHYVYFFFSFFWGGWECGEGSFSSSLLSKYLATCSANELPQIKKKKKKKNLPPKKQSKDLNKKKMREDERG